jgi:hypothetical protein
MKTRLDNLLKAINLADYDGVKTVDVDMPDLLLMRSVILDQQRALEKAAKEIHILEAKVLIKVLDKPVRLDLYI